MKWQGRMFNSTDVRNSRGGVGLYLSLPLAEEIFNRTKVFLIECHMGIEFTPSHFSLIHRYGVKILRLSISLPCVSPEVSSSILEVVRMAGWGGRIKCYSVLLLVSF